MTELVHQKTLKRNIKAKKEIQAGLEPKRPEVYFNWGRDDFLAALQALIDVKEGKLLKAAPYNRYVLVIHTNEYLLDRETVDRFLEGSVFQTKLIAEVVLGLSYHPSVEPNGGYCPAFRLNLTHRE